MTNIEFIGTWKLVSWESKSSDGKISQPFGQNPVGYLTYTEDRHMSVAIMKKNRLNIEITSQELTKARLVFLKPWLLVNGLKYVKATLRYLQASANYISYSGKYQIKDNKVIHHVEISLFPDWVGIDLERQFEFFDTKLLLITPPLGGQPQYLTWERI